MISSSTVLLTSIMSVEEAGGNKSANKRLIQITFKTFALNLSYITKN